MCIECKILNSRDEYFYCFLRASCQYCAQKLVEILSPTVKVVEKEKLIGLGYFAAGLIQAGDTELDEVRGVRNISRV